MGTEYNDSGKRKELILGNIRHVESQISGGINAGADLFEVIDMITGAKMMLDAGMVDDAEQLANQARRLAGIRIMQYERLSNFIKRGRHQIRTLTETGTYTDDALRMLEKAEEAMGNSDYELGIGYAIKCIECTRDIVEKKRPKQENPH